MPSHCSLPGNEHADTLAKEASELPQEDVPVDVQTVFRATTRAARATYIAAWPAGWYRHLMGDRLPRPVTGMDRATAVDVHQLRAGHWYGSAQYQHWMGRNPSPACQKCEEKQCPAGWCRVCGEKVGDLPQHILTKCPALMGWRLTSLGSIHPRPEVIRSNSVVAALGRQYRHHQSHLATPF